VTGRVLAQQARRPHRRRTRRLLLALLAVIAVAFVAVTLALFAWPAQGLPPRVDAIVMLNGPGHRLRTAEDLGWAHRAPMLVVSSNAGYPGSSCAARIPRVTVICFSPSPATTRGEAEYVGRLARRYHWRSVVLVTITPQITPGRIWLRRCLTGTVYAVASPLPDWQWPGAMLHEWGALIRATLFERTC
jgi:uncharacterized SAM-binding protein YcdF (DUF218 family)